MYVVFVYFINYLSQKEASIFHLIHLTFANEPTQRMIFYVIHTFPFEINTTTFSAEAITQMQNVQEIRLNSLLGISCIMNTAVAMETYISELNARRKM